MYYLASILTCFMPGLTFAPWVMIGIAGAFLAVFLALVFFAIRGIHGAVSTGAEALAGATGEIIEWNQISGTVRAAGTIWKARSSTAYILKKDDKIRVLGVDGLCLLIEPSR